MDSYSFPSDQICSCFLCCPSCIHEPYYRCKKDYQTKALFAKPDAAKFSDDYSRRPLTPVPTLSADSSRFTQLVASVRGQRWLLQTQSPLFFKLPPEIREVIWQESIEEQVIHITTRDRDLKATRHICYLDCFGRNAKAPSTLFTCIRYPCWEKHLIAPLLTCRRMSVRLTFREACC
jgi:hypothetical protein